MPIAFTAQEVRAARGRHEMLKPSKPSLCALLALTAAVAPAGAQAAQSGGAAAAWVTAPARRAYYYSAGQRDRFELDGAWHYRADAADRASARTSRARPHSRRVEPVTIPNAWNATDLSDKSDRGRIGWYRKDFRLPPGGRPTAWVLRFESVNYRATAVP